MIVENIINAFLSVTLFFLFIQNWKTKLLQ